MHFIDRNASDKADLTVPGSRDRCHFVSARFRIRDTCMDCNRCCCRLAAVENCRKVVADHAHCRSSADSRASDSRRFIRILLHGRSVRKEVRPVLSDGFEHEFAAGHDRVLSAHRCLRGILFHILRIGRCRAHASLGGLRLRAYTGKLLKDRLADCAVARGSYCGCPLKYFRGPLVRLPVTAVAAGLLHSRRALRSGLRPGSGLHIGDRPYRQCLGFQRSLKVCGALIIGICHGKDHPAACRRRCIRVRRCLPRSLILRSHIDIARRVQDLF